MHPNYQQHSLHASLFKSNTRSLKNSKQATIRVTDALTELKTETVDRRMHHLPDLLRQNYYSICIPRTGGNKQQTQRTQQPTPPTSKLKHCLQMLAIARIISMQQHATRLMRDLHLIITLVSLKSTNLQLSQKPVSRPKIRHKRSRTKLQRHAMDEMRCVAGNPQCCVIWEIPWSQTGRSPENKTSKRETP